MASVKEATCNKTSHGKRQKNKHKQNKISIYAEHTCTLTLYRSLEWIWMEIMRRPCKSSRKYNQDRECRDRWSVFLFFFFSVIFFSLAFHLFIHYFIGECRSDNAIVRKCWWKVHRNKESGKSRKCYTWCIPFFLLLSQREKDEKICVRMYYRCIVHTMLKENKTKSSTHSSNLQFICN